VAAAIGLATEILGATPALNDKPLILADKEHYTQELFAAVGQDHRFNLLSAKPACRNSVERWRKIPAVDFIEHWPGYATHLRPYHFQSPSEATYYEYVQRSGLRPEDLHFQGFLGTAQLAHIPALTKDYPQRWQVEECFKFKHARGWHRAGTLNLNIRYGHLSMVLLAQAAPHQLRQQLGTPFGQWGALHFARHLFEGVEGDVRVEKQTIVVTLYNSPNAALLQRH